MGLASEPAAAERSLGSRYVLYALVGATSAVAYLALWFGGRSPWARYLDHRLVGPDGMQAPIGTALFVIGWTVMVTAMMLPTAVPMFDAFDRVVHRRPERRRLLAILAAGFVGVWALCGYMLIWADLAVHSLVGRWDVVADRAELVGAGLLIVAGLYQFSDLKRRCLTQCRSPRSLIVPRWSGSRAGADAMRIGIDYGVSCLGCCWTLMVLLFALGTGNVGLMLAFGVLMAVEKNVPRAHRLTLAVGAALVVAGIALALSSFT
jgi:predicted metal-binding membrane protein